MPIGFLDHLCQLFCVCLTVGMADHEDVIFLPAAAHLFAHHVDECPQSLLASMALSGGNQLPFIIHLDQWFDGEHAADDGGRTGDRCPRASDGRDRLPRRHGRCSADSAGPNHALHRSLRPFPSNSTALYSKQSLSQRSAQRIDDLDVITFFPQLLCGERTAVISAAQTGRKRQTQDIFSGSQLL